MIRDLKAWCEWEDQWQRQTPSDPDLHFKIFDALLEMAKAVGAWPPEDIFEGLEKDIELARKVNTYVKPPEDISS